MPLPLPLPPKKLIDLVGGGTPDDHRSIGEHFFEIFKSHGLLMPEHRVLDVGCGCGRIAAALVAYLKGGCYEGFDVIPSLVEWSQANITPRYPAFRFQHVDLYNKTYHPRGKVPPKDFRFPYPDASFDFAFLTSVFTHMLPDDVAHYAREIARTLRPGGTALATFFLLNNESLRLKDTKASSLSIRKPYLKGQVLVYKRWRPEAAVAYPEETVRRIFRESGLLLREPILFGTWCGRETGISFQDIVIAENPTNGKTYCPQI